jgi:hypothetical protein
MQLITGVDVGDVHLDDGAFERLERIDDGNRGEGIGGGVDDDGVGCAARLLDETDECARVVGLMDAIDTPSRAAKSRPSVVEP